MFEFETLLSWRDGVSLGVGGRREEWLEEANIAKARWEDRGEIPKGFS